MTTHPCSTCGERKPADQFYSSKSRSTGVRSECKACGQVRVNNNYKAFREFVDAYKMERGCARCGYAAHPAALDFNHLNPEEKSFAIAKGHRKSLKVVQAEIDKCEVLCANCHRIHSYENKHTGPKARL